MIPKINLKSFLETHLTQRVYNHTTWFNQATNAESFPYHTLEQEGVFSNEEYLPPNQSPDMAINQIPALLPSYVVTIPVVPPKQEAQPGKKIVSLLEKIRDEAFGFTPAESQICKRLAVVLFANRLLSIDAESNEQMVSYLYSLPRVNGISYKIFGNFWIINWQRKPGFSQQTYDFEIAYRLLKSLKPAVALQVRDRYESSAAIKNKIPYQRIRQRLINHEFTVQYIDILRRICPTYLSIMDDDFTSLRTQKGLFSHYDDIFLSKALPPHVMTTGYWVSDAEYPAVRLGIKMDMKVREALASVIPMAPYYPEPNISLLIQHPLTNYSFIGKGTKLESRRLFENALARGLIEPARMHFVAIRSLVTTAPDRMYADTIKRIASINLSNLGQKKVLKALRGLSQVHFFPKMWADQVYLTLPIRAPLMTNITKSLMDIFACFDPINLAYSHTSTKYTKNNLSSVLSIYPHFSAILEQALQGIIPFEEAKNNFAIVVNNPQQQIARKAYFAAYFQNGLNALTSLQNQGLNAEWQSKVVRAACASGTAMLNCLVEVYNGQNYV